MDSSSTVGPGQPSPDGTSCDLDDWEDLKELFAKAAEVNESQEARETIPLLRGVIHECHRFMKAYHDPSVIFSSQSLTDKPPEVPTPPEEHIREWLTERPPLYPPPGARIEKKNKWLQAKEEEPKKCKCKDLPTAFYTVLGTTLFFFGNLIAQDPSLALEGEPTVPTPYWLSALDVFEIGENLPIRTSGRTCPGAPEDWRMGVVWGRTLVCIAEEILNRQKGPTGPPPAPTPAFNIDGMPAFGSSFIPIPSPDEPQWPEESPFALIVARRPPTSRRLSLASTTPNELLLFAQDQFARGMFHMPHPKHNVTNRPSTVSNISIPPRPQTASTSPADSVSPPQSPGSQTFSRAKELYTIGSEVLHLAEKLDSPSERRHWAHWADGVFSQMKMESDADVWRSPLTRARGRCSLIVGSAMAEEMEGELERGEMEVLNSQDAEDARDALRTAVQFLEKAMEISEECGPETSKASQTDMVVVEADGNGELEEGEYNALIEDSFADPDAQELKTLLAEALVTLANLTADSNEREALYSKAQKAGGASFELDDEDDRMDETS